MIAKVQKQEIQEREIWNYIIRYANGGPDYGASPAKSVEDFTSLVSIGFDWIGGDGRDGGEDIEVCQDVEDGASLNELADRYRLDFRLMLAWLIAPDRWKSVSEKKEFLCQEFAAKAGEFLRYHATGIRLFIGANTEFDQASADSDGRRLIYVWPEWCISVITPVCKFVVDQIGRYDKHEELLQKVIPIGHCARPGCERFFIIERVGRGRFCSDSCRSKAGQSATTKAENAARMAVYRKRRKDRDAANLRIAKQSVNDKGRAV